jgi:DNA-directed RNA polymerase specialized sigma24 family protein
MPRKQPCRIAYSSQTYADNQLALILTPILSCREVRYTAVAEDLHQEAFRIILEKIRQGDIREPESLSGFVCGVARNLTIDYFRRAARQESMAEIEEAMPLPHPAPVGKRHTRVADREASGATRIHYELSSAGR